MNRMLALIVACVFSTSAFAKSLPTGNTTPEGVACDMATAFINADSGLWKKVVLRLQNPEYQQFIDKISKDMDVQSKLPKSERSGPMLIGLVFGVGNLSRNGPNSYAYAAKNIEEIGFVDVVVQNFDGSRSMNRTFVAKKNNTWYALPRPDLFPLLTSGLNDEPVTRNVVYQRK